MISVVFLESQYLVHTDAQLMCIAQKEGENKREKKNLEELQTGTKEGRKAGIKQGDMFPSTSDLILKSKMKKN